MEHTILARQKTDLHAKRGRTCLNTVLTVRNPFVSTNTILCIIFRIHYMLMLTTDTSPNR
jgi:hypothetical protein